VCLISRTATIYGVSGTKKESERERARECESEWKVGEIVGVW
jgi:hypothetical protein